MFKKALFAKFEWHNLPEPLTDEYVEQLIFNGKNENFAAIRMPNGGEYWGHFSVQTWNWSSGYQLPKTILVTLKNDKSIITDDFCLFNAFNELYTDSNKKLYECYTELIKAINNALTQHVAASTLIVTIRARSAEEAEFLKKRFKGYPGITIVKPQSAALDEFKPMDFIQFEITPRTDELEQLKHNLENDLFLRFGIQNGIELTHITNANIKDSEQARDLINANDLKRRENFCERYNKWTRRDVKLGVEIHAITPENTVEKNISTTTQTTATTQTEQSDNE